MTAPAKPRRQRATSPSAATPRVLDSSCWLEFFADSAQADHFAPAINGLPMVDILIYATARQQGAERWTQARHFEGLPGVKFFAWP